MIEKCTQCPKENSFMCWSCTKCKKNFCSKECTFQHMKEGCHGDFTFISDPEWIINLREMEAVGKPGCKRPEILREEKK